MRKVMSVLTRQIVTATLSALAVAAMIGSVGSAGAADLDVQPVRFVVHACPKEVVILFDERGYPTVPARTPYFYCVTGTTLMPGDIPPPREYCC